MLDPARGRLMQRIGPLLAVAWLLSLFVAFALVQMPVSRAVAMAVARAALDAAAVAALVAAGGAIGALIIRDDAALLPAERFAARTLAGLAAISLLVLAIGLLGIFPPRWLAWLLTLGLLAGLHRPLAAWWANLRSALQELAAPLDDPFTRWLRRGVVVLLALAALMAFLPPAKWDALVYHLTLPQQYLAVGQIIPRPDNHFSGFPQLVEMLYTWLMLAARPHAAAALHGVFGGLSLLLTFSLAQRAGRPAAGWLALVILLVSQTLWRLFYWPYVDLALAAYTLAALTMLLAWAGERERRTRWLLAAGFFTGCMMATKYTAASFTLGAAALTVWLARRDGVWPALRALLMVALPAMLVFAPWLLKNTLLYGNPIAPFGAGMAGFDSLDQWYYLRPGTGLSPVELLIAPIQATVFGSESTTYQATAGALIFGLLPLALIGWRRRDAASRVLSGRLLLFALPGLIGWSAGLATSWFLVQTRLLYPIFPAFALVSALALEGWREQAQLAALTRLVKGVVLAALALALLGAGLDLVRAAPLRVIAGLQAEDEYLLDELGAHYAAMQAVNELPEGAHVLFLWEPRTFYCQHDCEPDSMINNWWHDREVYGTPERIAERWRERGYTHVLIYDLGGRFLIEREPYDPMTEADWEALQVLRDAALTRVWEAPGAYSLYELHAGATP